MKGTARRLFWDLYAQVYDAVLLRLLPYRQLIMDITVMLNPREGQHILDAGCGTGNVLLSLLRAFPGLNVAGLDFSSSMLKRAKDKYKKFAPNSGNVTFMEADLNAAIPFNDQEFDGVVCVNVLYSVDNPSFLLEEINRVLKINGKLILVTPPFRPQMGPVFREHVQMLKRSSPRRWVFLLIGQIISLIPPLAAFLLINCFIKGKQTFYFFTGEEISALLKVFGFELICFESVYGNQDWFLEAVKRVPEDT